MALYLGPGKNHQAEAEKPFWISFSDLMTALMVLFLVAMAVAIHEVKAGVDNANAAANHRSASIHACMDEVQSATRNIPGITVKEYSIDFGARANFELNRHDLTREQVAVLRAFVPQVVAITKDPGCERWLKRVVVDGFASKEGTYLRNLDLSIERSERVLCVLLDPWAAGAPSEDDRRLIQKLFFVGGSSSNSLKTKPAESRRIELKLEFYELKEPTETNMADIPLSTDSTCPIDQR
jgi:outer membrane protein OmpA-like peptidoglycan-associated protein